MSVEISAADLLTAPKLKNRDATFNLHIDQCNIPSGMQFSAVTKQILLNKDATVQWK